MVNLLNLPGKYDLGPFPLPCNDRFHFVGRHILATGRLISVIAKPYPGVGDERVAWCTSRRAVYVCRTKGSRSMVEPELLRRCLHLSDLSDSILARLADIAESQSVSPDTKLFSDMDPADQLYLIVRGEVRLCCEMGSGEVRVMDTVNDGELFAWSALVEPFRYTSTAITNGPTELVTFDAPLLRRMCEADQELGYQVLTKIVKLLSRRLASVRVQLAGS